MNWGNSTSEKMIDMFRVYDELRAEGSPASIVPISSRGRHTYQVQKLGWKVKWLLLPSWRVFPHMKRPTCCANVVLAKARLCASHGLILLVHPVVANLAGASPTMD